MAHKKNALPVKNPIGDFEKYGRIYGKGSDKKYLISLSSSVTMTRKSKSGTLGLRWNYTLYILPFQGTTHTFRAPHVLHT